MDIEDFIAEWDKIKDIQKVIVLKNKAEYYADTYDFNYEIERIIFVLNEIAIGNCNLKDIKVVR